VPWNWWVRFSEWDVPALIFYESVVNTWCEMKMNQSSKNSEGLPPEEDEMTKKKKEEERLQRLRDEAKREELEKLKKEAEKVTLDDIDNALSMLDDDDD